MEINKIINGDCKDVLKTFPDNSVDSIVTDPPAGIGFMGKEWDGDKGGRKEWIDWLSSVMAEGLRVLKPGGHALVWALPRTSHWTGTALENAGFEVRDCVYHLFGSGFPKSLNIGKAIDKLQGNEREVVGKIAQPGSTNQRLAMGDGWQEEPDLTKGNTEWEGWGTALKPAVECWWLVRKPLSENTVAENVLKHGTGGLNIDGSRIGAGAKKWSKPKGGIFHPSEDNEAVLEDNPLGRFPSHLIHDGSEVILAEFAKAGESKATMGIRNPNGKKDTNAFGDFNGQPGVVSGHEDYGSPARFFYTAKPSSSEKNLLYGEFEEFEAPKTGSEKRITVGGSKDISLPRKNFHPTVKAQSLMCYLIKLITPPKGVVLDMFAGSGSTLLAAKSLGHPFIGIEIDKEYCQIAEGRLKQGVLNF